MGVLTGKPLADARLLVVAVAALAGAATLQAQRGSPAPVPAARDAAPIDLTGYWVSVITEGWKVRMVTPKKGVYDSLPLNAEGRRVADTWDADRDERAGVQCRSYGAANIMRVPGRLRITWQDARTLRIETDAGTQTRLFHFDAAPAPGGQRTWQGYSVAVWQYAPGRGNNQPRLGNLKVVTTNMRPGYVRKNGAPHSQDAVLTEYFDVNVMPNGDTWLTVTARVDDPRYFSRPYITSSDFKKLRDASGWNPTPCSAR
jgi:hypothetical protein